MSTQNLMRWSGLALILGGVGIALFLITLYPLGSFFDPQVLINPQSVLAHTFHWIGGSFALLGYVLLGVATIRARILPRWGAVLVILGAILFNLPPQPVGPIPTFVTLPRGCPVWRRRRVDRFRALVRQR